jgi:hypothetical protein
VAVLCFSTFVVHRAVDPVRRVGLHISGRNVGDWLRLTVSTHRMILAWRKRLHEADLAALTDCTALESACAKESRRLTTRPRWGRPRTM